MRFPYDDDEYYTTDSDFGINDEPDNDYITNEICVEEMQNADLEKTNNLYYIGSIFQERKYAILATSITPRTFFQFDIESVQRYLYDYSCNQTTKPTIEIIQLQILPDLTYGCILKTHWLRMIQLHWQTAFAKRKQILEKRKTLESLRYFELHGRYMDGLHHLPSIRGLMKAYN